MKSLKGQGGGGRVWKMRRRGRTADDELDTAAPRTLDREGRLGDTRFLICSSEIPPFLGHGEIGVKIPGSLILNIRFIFVTKGVINFFSQYMYI